jgi:transcriptional regulator with XRE-family HTH domain
MQTTETPDLTCPQTTLRDLRISSGFSHRQLVERMKDYDGVQRTRTFVAVLESRGTEKLSVLRALAYALEKPFDVVEAAANRSKALASHRQPEAASIFD